MATEGERQKKSRDIAALALLAKTARPAGKFGERNLGRCPVIGNQPPLEEPVCQVRHDGAHPTVYVGEPKNGNRTNLKEKLR